METPESIERALGRLVPVALSEEGTESLHELIDELAEDVPSTRRPRVGTWSLGAAAALALLGGWMLRPTDRPATDAATPLATAEEPGIEFLSKNEGVVFINSDTSMLPGEDGSLHRAWHVQVVNQESFRDEETGLEVRVVHPRDEWVLMPVSAF